MTGPIYCAKDCGDIRQRSFTPSVGAALRGWLKPITFGVITKDTVNFQVVEYVEKISTAGMIQPLNEQALRLIKYSGFYRPRPNQQTRCANLQGFIKII